jgi:hypothetical protein
MREGFRQAVIHLERIQKEILLLREQRVMLGQHLAGLYGVQVKALNQAVKRNRARFPQDFRFQLSQAEFENLKSQFVTSSWGGIRRSRPYAFTEQGVAMLSSVPHSEQAVQVNIAIMRAFVQLRQVLSGHVEMARKFTELERRIVGHDTAIRSLFDAIRQLMNPPRKSKREIGFHTIPK